MSRCAACGHETVGARCVVCGALSVPGPIDQTTTSPWMIADDAPTQVAHPPTPLYPDDGYRTSPPPPPAAWVSQPQPWAAPYPAAPQPVPPRRSIAGGLAVGVGAGVLVLGLAGGGLALAGLLPPGATKTSAGNPAATATATGAARTTAGTPTLAATPTPIAPPPPAAPAAPAAPTADPVLSDLQPGVGQRLHQVQVTAPASLPSGRRVVVWISALKGGVPNRPHTFPYAVLDAGEARTVALHLGDEGSGDIGARYIVEACVAGGSSLTLANGYLRELAEHGPAEAAFRAEGIALPETGGDHACPSSARLVLTRTD